MTNNHFFNYLIKKKIINKNKYKMKILDKGSLCALILLTGVFVILICVGFNPQKSNCQENQENIINPSNDIHVSYSFEGCYNSDYQYMEKKYGKGNFVLYEVYGTFSHSINDSNFCENASIISMETIFQLLNENKIVKIIRPEINGIIDTVHIIEEIGAWVGDEPIDTSLISFNLQSAIDSLCIKGIQIQGNNVVLRKPTVLPEINVPIYMFGSDSSYTYIY